MVHEPMKLKESFLSDRYKIVGRDAATFALSRSSMAKGAWILKLAKDVESGHTFHLKVVARKEGDANAITVATVAVRAP